MYLNILENVIDPVITLLLEYQVNEGNLVLVEQNLHFKQDGAPLLYAVPMRQWLDRRFPGKWIGRRGAVGSPTRSLDLTPIDFFLWGHVESIVYTPPPENIKQLKNIITEECNRISKETHQNVRKEL